MLWVTPTDIDSNIIKKTAKKLSDEGVKVARIVPANTILVTCIASIGKNALTLEKSSFNQQINSLTPYKKYNPYFILTESSIWSKKMKQQGASGMMQMINKNEFSELETFVPNKQEQEKIGELFTNLDNLITLHQRKSIDFLHSWEQRKLGYYVLDLKSGLSRMLSEYDIGLPVLRANNINDCKLEMTHDVKYWYLNDPQGANTSNYFIAKDDILINFINSEAKMGTAAIVENTPNRPTIFTTNILRMKLNDKANSYFYLAQSMTSKYKNYIKGISKIAVNQASFTTVDFKNYDYTAPKIDEQVKIGELFHNLDNLITLHQRKHEKLVNLKQSLLNDMFI